MKRKRKDCSAVVRYAIMLLHEMNLEAIEMDLIGFIATIMVSVILCLFGIKLMRVGNAIAAAVLGAGIGYFGAQIFGMEWKIQMIGAAVLALILAACAAIFKRFGVFLFCLIGVTGILIFVTRPESWLLYAVYGGLGMLFAITAMNWLDAVYIFATSFVGGIGIGRIILLFADMKGLPWVLLAYVLPILVGCLVQSVLKSREIGKREAAHSAEVKKELSMEEEVESARAIFEEDEEEKREDIETTNE